jgi:hypothetical protein
MASTQALLLVAGLNASIGLETAFVLRMLIRATEAGGELAQLKGQATKVKAEVAEG